MLIAHTRTQPFNGPFSRTTRVSRYQKGKTNLDFTEARDGMLYADSIQHKRFLIAKNIDFRPDIILTV